MKKLMSSVVEYCFLLVAICILGAVAIPGFFVLALGFPIAVFVLTPVIVLVGYLLFFAIALIALDVVWYTAENSKDWYVVLSPIVLTAISVVCLLLSIGVQHIAAPNRTAKTDSRKGTARGSP